MKMKFFLAIILLVFTSCTKNMRFNQLFSKQEYHKAYELIRKHSDPNSSKYQSQELQVVIALVVSGEEEYLPILETILSKTYPEKTKDWVNFGKAWMRFISATKEEEFANVLEIIPNSKLPDRNMELLRITMQAHALLKIDHYQEVLLHLDSSAFTIKSADLLYVKAMAYLNLDKLPQAERYFKKSICLTKNKKLQSLGYFYLGEVAQKQNDDEKAFEYYTLSWELEPYNAETNFRIGTLLQKRSTESLHTRFYKTALRLNDNLANAWFSLNIQ